MSSATAGLVDEDPAVVELFDQGSRPDPYRLLAGLRERSPVPTKKGELLVVARYAECQQVLRDPTVRNDPKLSRLGRDYPVRQESLLFLDPPTHTRIRRLVSKAFTRRVVTSVEPRVHAIVDELLTAAGRERRLDVIEDFAFPLPVRIMCLLLGIPVEEYAEFEPAARRLGRVLDYNLVTRNDDLDDAEGARGELMDYLRNLIRRRRDDLGDDLLSELIRVEEEGERLTESELLATSVLLMVAGHETTANLIANGVLALMRHPDELARLAAEPDLADGASDEVLRFDPPIQFVMRVAGEDMVIGEREVPAGTAMLVLLASANRDPERYPDPDRFDITRSARDHLAFSAGAHFCVAAALGRMEGAVALSAFASRMIDPTLDVDSLAYRPNVNLRGLRTMTVTHGGVR